MATSKVGATRVTATAVMVAMTTTSTDTEATVTITTVTTTTTTTTKAGETRVDTVTMEADTAVDTEVSLSFDYFPNQLVMSVVKFLEMVICMQSTKVLLLTLRWPVQYYHREIADEAGCYLVN